MTEKNDEISVCLLTAFKCDFICNIQALTDVGTCKLRTFKITQF